MAKNEEGNKRFARDPRYCSWKSLLTTGDLFGAEFSPLRGMARRRVVVVSYP